MSLAHMNWAFDQRGLAPLEKLVLLALADYAHKTTGECWPSIPRVVEDTGLAESTVRKHIAALVERKVIAREQRFRDDGSQTSNLYHFPSIPPPSRRGEPHRQPEGAPPGDGGHEPVSEPTSMNRTPSGPVGEIANLVAKYAESTSPPPPPRARARVGRELKLLDAQGYGDYLEAALDRLIAKQLDPSLLPQLVAEELPRRGRDVSGILALAEERRRA